MISSDPVPEPTPTHISRAQRSYNLNRPLDNPEITAGSGVYSTDGLCPTFAPNNPNLFSNTFGIEFDLDTEWLVRALSAYEFVSAFGLDKEITYSLSHPTNFLLTDSGIP